MFLNIARMLFDKILDVTDAYFAEVNEPRFMVRITFMLNYNVENTQR